MTINEAKQQAAQEFGFNEFSYDISDQYKLQRVVTRALEIYGQGERIEGIKQGFKAARMFTPIVQTDSSVTTGMANGYKYRLVEHYLKKQGFYK